MFVYKIYPIFRQIFVHILNTKCMQNVCIQNVSHILTNFCMQNVFKMFVYKMYTKCSWLFKPIESRNGSRISEKKTCHT